MRWSATPSAAWSPSYQAIKHKLADMYVKIELARSSAYYGAWALATNAAELPEAAAAARIAATTAYDFCAKENLQTHGGMGFTWEVDCHLHLRRGAPTGTCAGRSAGLEGTSDAPVSNAATPLEPEDSIMDFNDSPAEAEFRSKARAWLDANAPQGEGEAVPHTDEPARIIEGKAWQARKADAGYACITWPTEWGGPGGTPMEQVIFDQEEARHGRSYGYFSIGLGMCLPTVMAFADDATKSRFVLPAVRGDEIWSQLFSEPSGRVRRGREPDKGGSSRMTAAATGSLTARRFGRRGAHYSDYGNRAGAHRPGRAQAQGPDDVLGRPEGVRHRCPSDPPGVGRQRFQRSVFLRSACARRPAPGRGSAGAGTSLW